MASEEGAVIACHTKAEFDDKMAKAKESGKLVIIDFTASWCGPCRIIAPVFIDLAKRFSGAVFLKVDVDELKEVTEDYDVQAMPTFVFVKNGETVHKVVGAKKESLQAGIERHLNLATTASESA